MRATDPLVENGVRYPLEHVPLLQTVLCKIFGFVVVKDLNIREVDLSWIDEFCALVQLPEDVDDDVEEAHAISTDPIINQTYAQNENLCPSKTHKRKVSMAKLPGVKVTYPEMASTMVAMKRTTEIHKISYRQLSNGQKA